MQWYLSPSITIFVGGVLPFGVIFVELFFILSSLWLDQCVNHKTTTHMRRHARHTNVPLTTRRYYYVFGFLFVVFAIMVLVCSELTIVLCYFQVRLVNSS